MKCRLVSLPGYVVPPPFPPPTGILFIMHSMYCAVCTLGDMVHWIVSLANFGTCEMIIRYYNNVLCGCIERHSGKHGSCGLFNTCVSLANLGTCEMNIHYIHTYTCTYMQIYVHTVNIKCTLYAYVHTYNAYIHYYILLYGCIKGHSVDVVCVDCCDIQTKLVWDSL